MLIVRAQQCCPRPGSCSTADVLDGWRDHRTAGGVVIDVAEDRVIADGLSMPHSPRRYRGAAWVLHSGAGQLCRIDPQTGRQEHVTFCPGFLHGLAFLEHFAVATLSLPRGGRFTGLQLDEELARRRVTPWCGIVVIDTRNGDVVEWLRLSDEFGELFDVSLVPLTRCAVAIAPTNPLLHDAITFEPEFAPLHADRPRMAPEASGSPSRLAS